MAAIQRTQMSSPKLGALAVAVAAAMLVGGAGGYLVRALSTQGPAPAHIATVQVRQATGTSADEPRSQWLREHATGTELDGLLKSVNYEGGATIANATGSKLNDLLKSVNYEGGATVANVAKR